MQKNSKEIFTKLIAMLLIITLNIANFLFVGEGLMSYAVDMVATNSNNVEFQVYFKNQDETTKQEIQVAEKDININSESENLYVTISVLREGYFNGKITLDSNNLSVIGCTKNAYLNSVDGNTINLNQIGSGNTVTLELQVKPKTATSIKSADLSAESIVNLTGVYTSSKGTKLVTTDIKGKTTVKTNLKSPENIQNILETNIITNKVFEIDGVNKRIIQILVKNNAKDNLYPIKTTNIEMKLPSDAEKIVAYARSTESTDSRINFGESNYNQKESALKINLENKEDSEGNISFAKNATDSLVVTAIYNESKVFTEEEKVITTKSTITTYDEKALITEKQATISEEVKGIINYEISKQEDAIYKGKIYTGEEREYKVNVRSYVNCTLTAETIKFKLDTTKYLVGEIEKESTIAYKDITIKKDDFTKVLGENGNINILNQEGTVVSSITNETEVDQKGNIVISLPENTLKADIETSVPTATGKIDFILTKSIVENTYQEDEIKTFTAIENAITKEDEIKVKGNTELKETITQAKLDIDTKELKAGKTTTVEITTTLLSDDETKDLYKNPVIKIAFPANTTQLTEPKYKILYTNGLEETAEGKVTEEDGRKVVIITLKGEQTTYPGKTIQGTVVVVSAELTVDKLQTSSNENITLTYTNENAKNYYQDGKITKDLKIVQDQNIIITNNIKELGVETVGKEEDKEVNIKATGETQTATIQIGAISNEEETITNAKILGKFPTKSSTNTMDITLTSNIKVTTGQEGVKIYYSSNENATEDLENSENAWTEDSNLADKRCYLIVVPSLNKGEKISAEYGVDIKKSTDEKRAEERFNFRYIKASGNVVTSDSTNVVLNMQQYKNVEIALTAWVGEHELRENEEVHQGEVIEYKINLKNNEEKNINNITVIGKVPEGTSLYTTKDIYKTEIQPTESEKVFKNLSIKQGETLSLTYQVKVTNDLKEGNKLINEIETNFDKKSNAVTNIVKKSDIIIEVKTVGRADNEKLKSGYYCSYRVLVTNNTEVDKENIIIEYKKNNVLYMQANNSMTIDTLHAGETYEIGLALGVKNIEDQDESVFYIESKYGNEVYSSNIIKEKVETIKVKVNLEQDIQKSNKEEALIDGDTILYRVNVKNYSDYTVENMELKIKISNYLDVEKVELNNKETSYKKEVAFEEDFWYLVEKYTLNPNESVELIITAKVNKEDLKEKKQIISTCSIYMEGSNICESNETSFYIDPTINTTGNDNKENNSTTENETDSTEDENDTNINPSIKEEELYNINGKVWFDEKENGDKSASNVNIKGVKVKLVDVTTGIVSTDKDGVEISAETNDDGIYQLSNIKEGKYIVIFEYDKSKYKPTIYQKEGIEESNNSDAILKSIKINGEDLEVAATDILDIKSNKNNIDLGLVAYKKFDLSLTKVVNNIEVVDNKTTKKYAFNEASLAKVEIDSKKLNITKVNIEYTIKIKNNGEISGYAKNIVDYIPSGLEFDSCLNKDWKMENQCLYNSSLSEKEIKPGETKELKLILNKKMKNTNTGLISNIAQILETDKILNKDEEESNFIKTENEENNKDQADVIIGVKTGKAIKYLFLIFSLLVIIYIFIFNKKTKK